MNNSLRFLIYFVFPLSASMTGFADEKEIVDDAIFVLEQNCIVCHNAEDAKGEITLDRDPLGLDDPSLILEAIEGSDPKMPKDTDPLLDEEIAALKKWIAAGAKIPKGRILKKPDGE